jgi:hypothetical protein
MWFVSYLASTGRLAVFGKRRGSKVEKRIDPNEFDFGGFGDAGNSLYYTQDDEPRITGLRVSRSELERTLKQLQESELVRPA